MKSSSDIANLIDDREREQQTAIKTLSSVEQAILLLRREIINLQGKRTDLEMTKSKASQNLRVIQSELRILKQEFWSAKNGGL